jgi:hypothetical protein
MWWFLSDVSVRESSDGSDVSKRFRGGIYNCVEDYFLMRSRLLVHANRAPVGGRPEPH